LDKTLEKFRNKLCVAEGSDNCGKSTVAKMLNQKLNNEGIPSIFTFQPGESEYGVHATFIRSLCKDKRWSLHPLSNMYAFFMDKVEQVQKVVVPALESGKTVICDRWNFSTTAYQLFGKQIMETYDMPREVADWLNYTSELGCKPNVVYYFSEKIKKQIGIRESDSGKSDLFETAGDPFFERVYKSYEEMANDPNLNFKRVKLFSTPEETLEELLKIEF
jgi:dTMP kinase